MSKITYPTTSPYATTKQSSSFIGLYAHRSIAPNREDQRVTISLKYNLRPDLLSYDLYGTPDYWWIFAVRNPNDIRDSIWDFTTGKVVWVPSVSYLKKVIG